MSLYELENKSHGISAAIAVHQEGSRWHFAVRLSTRMTRMAESFSDSPTNWAMSKPVAINMACQKLEKAGAILPEMQRQVLMLWLKQTNRAAFAGISDEARDELYALERQARTGASR